MSTKEMPDAYEMFLKVGADPEVEKLRRSVARGNKMKHVPALYLATAMALQGMTKQELEALKLRIEEKRVRSGTAHDRLPLEPSASMAMRADDHAAPNLVV